MSSDPVASMTESMTQGTVLGDLLKPVEKALERVRFKDAIFTSIGMMDFITIGVLRHLKSMKTLRGTIQFLLSYELATKAPVPRSTFSDALASIPRRKVLRDIRDPLRQQAAKVLPDRLANLPGLDQRSIYAVDGTYQKESAHFRKVTPKNGGKDNPKGHQLLSFYDVRLGCPCDVHVSTQSEHEVPTLRDYDDTSNPLTQEKGSLWLADRAFIDAPFWDKKKHACNITMITRMKSNLIYDIVAELPFEDEPINQGVIADQGIALNSSKKPWRLITYRTRRGAEVEFLTNELDLAPGLIAFLYSRRWEEEKCFDTWKNDFAMAKAWGKSTKSIENQVRMAIITSIVVAMLVYIKCGKEDSVDKKSMDKQEKRQAASPDEADGTDRPDWSLPIFRYTTKISRQVLRFFENCLFNKSSPQLYKRQLWPMLQSYL